MLTISVMFAVQVLTRSLEEGLKLEGLKRLNSTVVKRGSPDLNWESWDQTDLEYEDEKVLEKRRQLLQRELELQMKREETEEHHSKRRHSNTKQKKVTNPLICLPLSSYSCHSNCEKTHLAYLTFLILVYDSHFIN